MSIDTSGMTAEQIAEQAASILRAYRTAPPDTPGRRHMLREVGQLLVDLREHYTTQTGEPDWLASTGAYKAAVGDIYRTAGFSRSEQAKTSGTVRYHAGNYLREKLPADVLEDLGVSTKSPRERHVERRGQVAALLTALRPGSEAADVEPRTATASALSLLERVSDADVTALSEVQRRALLASLTALGRESRRIRAAAKG